MTTESIRNEVSSNRVFHVFAAILAAGVLIAALSFFSFYGQFFHGRQVRALQQGVMLDLQLVSEAEKAFHSKYGAYTTDLAALGIAPKAVVYKFGFLKPSPGTDGEAAFEGLDPSRMDLDKLKAFKPDMKMAFSPVTKLSEIEFAKLASYCQDCTATATTFKAIAAANLDDDAVLDVWTIDHTGKTEHLVNDLP